MKKTLISVLIGLTLVVTLAGLVWSQGQNFGPGNSTVINTTTSSITTIPATGLISDYQALAGETAATLKDYSGNNNTATGTVGTAPTITAVTGGISCPSTGAISLPTANNAAKTILLYLSMQPTSQASTDMAPVASTGFITGTTSAIALDFFQGGAGTPFQNAFQTFSANELVAAGLNFQFNGLSNFAGIGSYALAMDTQDRIYINGVDQSANATQNSQTSATVQAAGISGNYQACGVNSGIHYFGPGTIYRISFYSTVLNAAQVMQWHQATQNYMVSRGVLPLTGGTDISNNLFLASDSELIANGSVIPVHLTLSKTYNVVNSSQSAWRIDTQLLPFVQYMACPVQRPTGLNIAVLFAGTNDVAASDTTTQVISNTISWAKYVKQVCGYNKVLLTTPIDRNAGLSANLEALSAAQRNNWKASGFIDGLIDAGGEPLIGCNGCNANTTYFSDGVHETIQASYSNFLPLYNMAINRIVGNTDFSMANTYASVSTGAIALSAAATQSTNTMSFTSAGWTAGQFVPGTRMHCTGISVAGYNDAYPGWLILTNSGTVITAYNNATGLGNSTIAGSCIGTIQQDVDQYMKLNMGTGTFTMESCLGYTGQNIYIQNINGSSTTLGPWDGESITGPGTTTLSANTTAILQSQLTSSTAGGCSWVRLQ